MLKNGWRCGRFACFVSPYTSRSSTSEQGCKETRQLFYVFFYPVVLLDGCYIEGQPEQGEAMMLLQVACQLCKLLNYLGKIPDRSQARNGISP